MRILVPIPIRMSPPTISVFFQIFVHHFLPNWIQIYERTKVITPMMRAGKYILVTLAVSDTPTASASMLVAIPRTTRGRIENMSLS